MRKNGLLTPALSSFWEEREKNGGSVKVRAKTAGGATAALTVIQHFHSLRRKARKTFTPNLLRGFLF